MRVVVVVAVVVVEVGRERFGLEMLGLGLLLRL